MKIEIKNDEEEVAVKSYSNIFCYKNLSTFLKVIMMILDINIMTLANIFIISAIFQLIKLL